MIRRPVRRNGIVRVPKQWVEAAAGAFFELQEKGGGKLTIPLPLKVFPYAKIREALKAIYPSGKVPLHFRVAPINAGGSTGTKKDGGYPVDINITEQGASAVSTILHELRHVVQYLGDEVVKTKSGTFGRPSPAAVKSLRARKKAIKSGQIKATGFQAYLSGASEWQPWVGTTADKIVGKILAGNLTKTSEVNAAIRTGIVSSTFYTNTDPATRRELLRQVYTEVVRQLKGYTDIIPAKHPKAKPVAAGAAPKPKPSAPGVLGVLAALPISVRVKIEGAGPQIANEATYAGKDSKGRDKLEVPAKDLDAAHLSAEQFVMLAKQGSTLHGGTIYAVRIAHSGKESEVYVAGAKSTSAPPPTAPKAAAAPKPSAPKASAASGVPYNALGLTPDAAAILQKRRLPVGSGQPKFYVVANAQYHVKLKTQIKPGAEVLTILHSGWIRAMKKSDYPKMLALPELPMFSLPPTPKAAKPKAPKSEAEALALLATIVPAEDIAKYGPIKAVEYNLEGIEYGKPSYWMTPEGKTALLEATTMTLKEAAVLKALGWKKLTFAQYKAAKKNPRRTRRAPRRRTR
jgi:hypothetical protein